MEGSVQQEAEAEIRAQPHRYSGTNSAAKWNTKHNERIVKTLVLSYWLVRDFNYKKRRLLKLATQSHVHSIHRSKTAVQFELFQSRIIKRICRCKINLPFKTRSQRCWNRSPWVNDSFIGRVTSAQNSTAAAISDASYGYIFEMSAINACHQR